MSKENPNNRKNWIYFYQEDFEDKSTWKEVCEVLGILPDKTEVRINFDNSDVYVEEPEATEDGEHTNVCILPSYK